jgi:hypothetical protein
MEGEPIRALGLKKVLEYIPWLHVLNVWSPLETPRLRPLGMMNRQTLLERSVLRYRTNSTKNAGGQGGSFASDRLMPLHTEEQEW